MDVESDWLGEVFLWGSRVLVGRMVGCAFVSSIFETEDSKEESNELKLSSFVEWFSLVMEHLGGFSSLLSGIGMIGTEPVVLEERKMNSMTNSTMQARTITRSHNA